MELTRLWLLATAVFAIVYDGHPTEPSYGAPCSTLVNGVPVVVAAQQAKFIQDHRSFSKGGKRNIWPDEYGDPPTQKNTDWSKSDATLADEAAARVGDLIKGAGTANGLAKKYYRDKRPKR